MGFDATGEDGHPSATGPLSEAAGTFGTGQDRAGVCAGRRVHPMNHPMRRVATVVSAALLGVMLLGASAAQAGTPAGWSITATPIPSQVTYGKNAGYLINIGNTGPSNISQLFLVDDQTAPPSYVQTNQGSCNGLVSGVPKTTSGRLLCSFGALNAGATITVIVAYTTPTSGPPSSFFVTFELNTTGATFTKPGSSHGTVLSPIDSPTTTALVAAGGDFGGGFVISDNTVSDNQNVGTGNIQGTLVVSPQSFIGVTVSDGTTSTTGPCPSGTNLFGECSLVSVGGGRLFASPFKVVLTILGSAVPSGANTNNIEVLHTYTDSNGAQLTETISAHCPSQPPAASAAPCLVVSKVGKNIQIVIWLLRNGGIRSTF
jgi:Domain of unknown function DUF11